MHLADQVREVALTAHLNLRQDQVETYQVPEILVVQVCLQPQEEILVAETHREETQEEMVQDDKNLTLNYKALKKNQCFFYLK